jgi:hypothetical protein
VTSSWIIAAYKGHSGGGKNSQKRSDIDGIFLKEADVPPVK